MAQGREQEEFWEKHHLPLSRWALSYNIPSQIAAATRKMFACGLDDHMTRNESTPARTRRDHNDECPVMSTEVQSI